MAERHDSRAEDPDHGLDIDAAFADIVARWDGPTADRPADGATQTGEAHDGPADGPVDNRPGGRLDDRARRPRPPEASGVDPALDEPTAEVGRRPEPSVADLRPLFSPTWSDPLDSDASWDDEGRFVPPTPPPLPPLDPRRKAAWTTLVASPLLALAFVVLGWSLPGFLAILLVVGFVGSFLYLVATMSGGPQGGGHDDGAVI